MDLSQPPADVELRNIIDKLAQFVARNGPEFEQMTKNKQKGNPKFGFLFGGEHFNYYQYKVTTEQAILKAKASRDVKTPVSSNNNQEPITSLLNQQVFTGSNNITIQTSPLPTTQHSMNIPNVAASAAQWLVQASTPKISLTSLIEQQNDLNIQITQSEQNLAAQRTVLMQSQQTQIEDAIRKAINESLAKRAEEHNINLQEFDGVLQPIIDSCTKDSISTGKGWILNKTSTEAHEIISQYLLSKVTAPGVAFGQKLHIIYLVNDVLHHCVRKNADDLKKSLDDVVVPMFCNSYISATEEQQIKLNKLLTLWEGKSNYFSTPILTQLRNPEKSWTDYQADLVKQNANIVAPITAGTKASYDNYQSQHQAFVNHALQQIQSLEKQKDQLEQQNLEYSQGNAGSMIPTVIDHGHGLQQNNQIVNPPPLPPTLLDVSQQPPPPLPNSELSLPMNFDAPPPPLMQTPVTMPPLENVNFTQPPPSLFEHLPPDLIPDFSKPPPGFVKETMDDLIPSVPYFELPAGLMVPLIKLDDFEYKPIDPAKIRLPPAMPPNERLLSALDSFYQRSISGTRERLILDADGWEKLGLYEYYKAKNAAKKKKEDDIQNGLREKSRSPTPIKREKSRSKSPPKRKRYHSRSRSKSKERDKGHSRSRSRSPTRHRNTNGRRSPRRSSGSQRSYKRSRSRSRSFSPSRNRSPTPPSFVGFNYGRTPEQQIDEGNKGHQMLKKMGWSGAGLGSKEQGIEAPISGGEVRDRSDQYKGVGVNLHDPYESFRKSKGQAFITRMKARAEERMSK